MVVDHKAAVVDVTGGPLVVVGLAYLYGGADVVVLKKKEVHSLIALSIYIYPSTNATKRPGYSM